MKLTPMRFKDYTWPYNPESCRCVWERRVLRQKLPFGGFRVQDLGLWGRCFRGEGTFAGEEAYESFRELEDLFREEGAGLLTHPQWGTVQARFVSLELAQEPEPDFVRYRFEFWEEAAAESGFRRLAGDGSTAETVSRVRQEPVYYIVRKGDTLWGIAMGRGMALSALIALNPQIRNPNRIYPGDRVRVQ